MLLIAKHSGVTPAMVKYKKNYDPRKNTKCRKSSNKKQL
jgi:hypothetical protein